MKSLCCKMTDSSQMRHLALSAVLWCLASCQSLPTTPHLPKSLELTKRSQQLPHDSSPLAIFHQATPKPSAYHLVSTGADAFATRSILTNIASGSIDVQYYIWHDDEAGLLMLKHLWQAAERGVVVRLLLDDINGSPSLDKQLLAFASHPNIAVRLVNPFVHRKVRFVNYLTEPLRLNHRMHNKSMTFDRQVSIIGGRNIGNEYLNHDKNNTFADLDVLVVGAVVKDISQSFENYWQAGIAYDIQTLVKPSNHAVLFDSDIDHLLSDSKNQKALQTYHNAVKHPSFAIRAPQEMPLRWADMVFVADDVSKLDGQQNNLDAHLIAQLQHMLGRPTERLSIISSYFVPTKEGVKMLVNLAKSGVKISILTNSFDATDVGAVHAGYGHWRKKLLKAGISLYELKSTAKNSSEDENKFWRTKQTTTTSLHAKAFAFDNTDVFIGSYNIDPRSANINTELGVLIKDKELAKQVHHALNNITHPSNAILHQAYQVMLDKNNNLQWRTIEDNQEVIYHTEPSMNLSEKTGIWLLSMLPIDWLL